MSKEDFKCSVNPVNPEKVAEEWRFDSVMNAVKNANEICRSKGIKELTEGNIKFSGGKCGGTFEMTLEDGTFIRINGLTEDQMYNIEVFEKPSLHRIYGWNVIWKK